MGKKTKEFGEKLKNLLESRDMTQRDLAKKLFITDGAMSLYVSGERLPRLETIRTIAKYFNVSTDYLLGIDTTEKPKVMELMELEKETIKVPILGSVRAGMPALITDDNIIGYEFISESMAKQGEIFALKIKGDSMEPRMYEGDIVFVKRTPNIESGKIGVVLVNGDEATIKKIIKSPSGITLIPFNNKYPAIMYSNDDIVLKPVIVLGEVIELRAKM